MKAIKIPSSETEYQLFFKCPGCNDHHAINQSWEFNGDFEQPSISPSIRVEGARSDGNGGSILFTCHSWITKGRIKFFPDSSHDKAGTQWHDLPDVDKKLF